MRDLTTRVSTGDPHRPQPRKSRSRPWWNGIRSCRETVRPAAWSPKTAASCRRIGADPAVCPRPSPSSRGFPGDRVGPRKKTSCRGPHPHPSTPTLRPCTRTLYVSAVRSVGISEASDPEKSIVPARANVRIAGPWPLPDGGSMPVSGSKKTRPAPLANLMNSSK